MKHSLFLETIQRIHRHIEFLQENMKRQANRNPIRVQAMYMEFQTSISLIYQEGSGWIEKDVHRILDAVQFAANKHQLQVRKDQAQTSYLIHPLSVCHHLITIGGVRDPDIIIASLLHDLLEDTHTANQELVDSFGERAAAFVQEVTDDKTLPKEERKKLQILTAPNKSAGAAQIKLADKWDNLTDLLTHPLVDWPEERIQSYFEWAKKVVEALPWVNAPLLRTVQEVINKGLKQKSLE